MEEDDPARPSQATQRANRPWRRRLVAWGAAALVFAALFSISLHHESLDAEAASPKKGAAPGPVAVTAATARKGDIAVHLTAIGTVTPVFTSTITSQVTGIITAVHYREGQRVRIGDALIDIDPRSYEAQLEQARGLLERDKHVLAQAQMDLERYRNAWARNAIPKQTLDDQEQIVRQAQGTVRADQGAVDYDQVLVDYCHIKAPVDGRVGLRLVDPGNVVQANATNPLVVVTQEDPITVIFTLAEDNIDDVQAQTREGKRLVVDAFDRTNQKLIASGSLLTLDNQIDTNTGTVRLRAQFDNAGARLFPNQFVNARLLVRTISGATLIPASTIQHNGQTAFVYVIVNDAVQARTVKPGVSDSGMTAVEGVNPGELIADSSFERLQPNSKVKVTSSSEPGSAASSGMNP